MIVISYENIIYSAMAGFAGGVGWAIGQDIIIAAIYPFVKHKLKDLFKRQE